MNFEISLSDLRFYAYHGVFEEERKLGNEFRVSLSVLIPYNEAMENDDIASTVSYADLFEIIREEIDRPVKLLETLALRIVKKIRNNHPMVAGGKLTIEKVHPPIPRIIGSASVTLNF